MLEYLHRLSKPCDFREKPFAMRGRCVNIANADGQRKHIDVGASEYQRRKGLHFIRRIKVWLHEVGKQLHFVFKRTVSRQADIGNKNRVFAFVHNADRRI